MKGSRPVFVSMVLLGIAIIIEVFAEVLSMRSGHRFLLGPLAAIICALVVILCALAASNKR